MNTWLSVSSTRGTFASMASQEYPAYRASDASLNCFAWIASACIFSLAARGSLSSRQAFAAQASDLRPL